MKVVILAGGFGTRISEESYLKPKPLIEIGGKPILWHIMKLYSFYDYNEFIICLGYKGNMIKEFFSQFYLYSSDVTFDFRKDFSMTIHNNVSEPWKVTLIDTGLNTMTGGRIKRIKNFIGKEDFMFTYGDGVSNVNIRDLVKFHKDNKKITTITAVKPCGRFGAMELNDNIVTDFREKNRSDENWINGGFFVTKSEIFNYIDDDLTILEKKPLETLSNMNELVAFKHDGFWQAMDTLRDKNYLEELWNIQNAPWKVWNKQ